MSTALTPANQLKQSILALKPQFKMALPSHISVDKFVRVLQTAIATTPNLAKADRNSLFGACVKASQDGLLCDGKEAALVPFGDSVTYMPMVAGILKKVRNSGELSSITSMIIYKNDKFEFYVDEKGEHLVHRPLLFGDRGERIGVYALAVTKDGASYIEIMDNDQVQKIKNCSRGKNGPWNGPFEDEMVKKSAIRRLAKRLPMSTDLEHTITADDDFYSFDQPAEKEVVVDVKTPAKLGQLLADEPIDVTPKKKKKKVEEPIAAKVELPIKNYAPSFDESYEGVPV